MELVRSINWLLMLVRWYRTGDTPVLVCVVLAVVTLASAAACSRTASPVSVSPVHEATQPASTGPGPTSTPPPVEEAGFGGLFLDADDNSILYIYLVNPSQAAAEAAAVRHFGHDRMQNIREVRPLKGQYTIEELREYYEALRDARPLSMSEVTMTDLDEGRNRIEVGVSCESDRDRVRLALEQRLNSLGVPVEAIVFEVRGRPHPLTSPLTFECIPAETIDPATGLLTPGFGGLHVESDVASIYLLEPSQEAAEELVLEQVGLKSFRSLREIRALKGLYTWTQLTEWYELIENEIMRLSGTELIAVDPRKNRITIEVRRGDNSKVEGGIEDVLSKFEVPPAAVILLKLSRTGLVATVPPIPQAYLEYDGRHYPGWRGSYCWPTSSNSTVCAESAGWRDFDNASTVAINRKDGFKIVVSDERSSPEQVRLTVFPITETKPVLRWGEQVYSIDGDAVPELDVPEGIYFVHAFLKYDVGDVSYGFKLTIR